MKKKIGIISAGAWGTAIAKAAADNGHHVEIWDIMEDVVADINNNHANSRYLMGVKLPDSVKASTDLKQVADNKDFLILATPSKFILDIVKQMIHVHNILEGKTPIAVLTKGFMESETVPVLMTEAIEKYLPGSYKDKLVYISGPSHAEEVARGKITALVSASKNTENAESFKNILGGKVLRLFISNDVEGVQVCAALKNVVAIAYGMIDAFKEFSDNIGDNTESFLLAAGLNEISKAGIAMGSTNPETFSSIAGVGDLDVTCKSVYGRNRRFGREIIETKKLDGFKDIHDLMNRIYEVGYLPEGVFAAYHAQQIARKYDLKLPICDVVFKVLNKEINVMNAFEQML